MRAAAVLLSILAAGPAAGIRAEPADAAALVREGFALFDRDEYAAARARFEQALASEGDEAAKAEAHRGLGRVLFRLGDYAASREHLERARALHRALADALGEARATGHLGSVALMMGNRAQAAGLYAEALGRFQALGAPADELETRYNRLYVAEDAAARALEVEEGLALARRSGDGRFEGRFLHESADVDFAQGRFSSAFEKLEEAIAAFERAGARRELGRALNSLSRLERTHGQVERAFETSRHALAVQEGLGDLAGALQSLDQMADARSALGAHAEALALYERAREHARTTGSPHLATQMQGRLSRTYLRMGQPARAVPLLEEVVARDPSADSAPLWYGQLSRAYLGVGRLADALAAAEKALQSARSGGLMDRVLPALHARASALHRLGRREEALADAREEIAALERLRAELLPDDFMKRGFADQHQAVFELTIELFTGEGRQKEALATAEQARARALLDLLATRDAGGTMTVPAASADEVAATAGRLGSTVLSYFVGREALFIWAASGEGTVAGARVPVTADRVWELVRETRRALRGGGGRRGEEEGPALPTRGGGRLLLAGSGASVWRELGDLLIAPVRAHLPRGGRLTIVPHGPLFLVSFAALRDGRGRYLIEDHELHYAPSAAVLQMTARRARPPGVPARRVFMADPRAFPDDGGRPLPPLPGTRREVDTGARRLKGGDTVVLTGSEATKANLRRLAGDAGLLHFATHGVVRDDRPLESFLALDRGDGGDGRLTLQDIQRLDLSASLVFLSACRTGLGQLSSDGIVGLTRAFLVAGAPSVVATLWDVADEPTFRLVSRFYAQMATAGNKARALRAAQLSMLRALRAGEITVVAAGASVPLPEHPALWAGFVLVGEP